MRRRCLSLVALSLFCAVLCPGKEDEGFPFLTRDELWKFAREDYAEGKFGRAAAYFDELISRSPDEAGLYFNRASARLRLGKLDEAEADMDVFLSYEPRSANGFELRSAIRLAKGNLAPAIADAEVGLRLEKRPRLQVLRGRALAARGEFARALPDLDAGLAADAGDDEARFARGECRLQLGRFADAKTDFLALAERHPDNPRLRHRLGDVHFFTLDFPASAAAYRKITEDGKLRAGRLRMLGYALHAGGEHEAALEPLKAALALEGDDWLAMAVLHFAEQEAKLAGAGGLGHLFKQVQDPWGKALCEFLLKKTTEDELLKQAQAVEEESAKALQLCTAYYFIGANRVLAGDRVAGRAMLKEALEAGRDQHIVRVLARARLDRLTAK